MTYHEIDNGIGSSLHSVILWQYENAEKLKAFIESMCEAAYLAVDDFWDKWATFRTNVDLAASKENATFSLSVIGATYGIPRPDNISDAMYAKLIKCRMKLAMTTPCSTSDYTEYINDLFDGYVTVSDNLDMSVSFTESFPESGFSDWTWVEIPEGCTVLSLTWYSSSSLWSLIYDDGIHSYTISVRGSENDLELEFIDLDYHFKAIRIDLSSLEQLYSSDISKDYGIYWLILPTGVKRGITSWGGNVFGFDKEAAYDNIPAIGPFGTSFMTQYQYQFIKETST